MATQNFINECKNRANANRLAKFDLQAYDRFDLELKGNTYQQTYTGKNLLNYNNLLQPALNKGIICDINGDIRGVTTDDRAYSYDNSNWKLSLPSGTYKFTAYFSKIITTLNAWQEIRNSNNVALGSVYATNKQQVSITFTLNETTNIGIMFKIFDGICKVQIESGSNATSWEKYVGGTASPNPDYPQSIENVTGLQKVNVCGKNLFNSSTLNVNKGITSDGSLGNNTSLSTSDYIIVKPSTDYYLSNVVGNIGRSCAYYDNNKTFISAEFYPGEEVINKKITTPNNAKYMRVAIKNGTENTQVEQNSQASSYESYTGNTYEIDLRGKNKFDGKLELGGYDAGVKDSRTERYRCANKIPVKPNTTYTFSINGVAQKYVYQMYDKNGNYISETDTQTGTFTTPSNCYYITFRCFVADFTSDYANLKIQLEEGSTATYYVKGNEIELNKIGDYQDRIYKDNGKWYIEKKTGVITFEDGSVWGQAGTQYTGTFSAYRSFNSMLANSDTTNLYCNYLKNQQYDAQSQGITKSVGYSNLIMRISNDIVTDLTGFRTWLTNTKPTVYYVLATPTTTEITNTDLINQLESIELLKGTNNITITSEDLPVIFDYSFWNGDTEVDEDDRFLEVNQTNYLTKMELKDSCYVNNELIGSIFTKSAEVELLNLPANTELVGQTITPEIGVRYANDSTEYITFDDYVIESVKDEQTASNTSFSAMNGSTLLDKEYVCSLSFDSGATHTINEFYQDACSQIGLTPTDVTFDNSEIVMTGNPFTNKETIRTVLSEVEKVSCSIAKFDWANGTISLTWLSNQIDYEFNTSDYSTLEGSMEKYGPLNVIIIANAQLDGENVVMTDEESVAEYGEHQIIIDSPYFLYTEELRTQAIQAIYDKLDGLTYYDLKLTTPYGKPFLNIGDKIRINTNENQVYDTYILSHTFTYDGTFQSIIESPALTQEEQTIKNEFKGNSVREKLRRTELMVDKTTGEITAIAQRVSEVESKTVDNYTKEEIDELILNVEGVTNKLINSGGNNIFRNTGLWFEDTSNIEYLYPSNTLYPSDELYMLAEPYFEYWQGKVVRMAEDKAANLNALLLQNTTLSQKQQVRNGSYTISFKYKKLIQLSTASVTINGETIALTENEGEFVKTIDVTSQYINISFLCDTDNGVEIYDLMGNVGEEKAEYSQHQNETTTDTVNISKGITITSSDTNTTFKANSDGIRVYNSRNLETPMTEFTDTGTDTKKIIVENEATIVEVLFKKVGNNTWLTKL